MCCSRSDQKEINKELVIMCCRNHQKSKGSKLTISHNVLQQKQSKVKGSKESMSHVLWKASFYNRCRSKKSRFKTKKTKTKTNTYQLFVVQRCSLCHCYSCHSLGRNVALNARKPHRHEITRRDYSQIEIY